MLENEYEISKGKEINDENNVMVFRNSTRMHNYTDENLLNWSDIYFDLVFKNSDGSDFGCSYWLNGRFCQFDYPNSGDINFGLHNIVSDSRRFNIGGNSLYLADRY